MKKITAILLFLALALSLTACAPNRPADEAPDTGLEEDVVPTPSKEPVPDPAESYTVAESDAAGVYDATGVYFFGVDAAQNISQSIIGEDELDEPIGEMRFTTEGLTVTYRVHKDSMINADQAGLLFGTKEWESRESVRISNNIATLNRNEGGEALLYWYDVEKEMNCCAHFSTSEDQEALALYANLLYAFVHSDIMPE
ncbi:MAG: hypothetical protein PUB32_05025 [Clostridiales bacterium]|nr:hypothetical protein [Clostridiales bacterium]